MNNLGNCQIVARPIRARAVREDGMKNRCASGADVLYAAPDDLHYEIEPTRESEDEGEGGTA